jgi:hypothetical protein
MAPGALWIRVGKPVALPKAPVRCVRQQNAAALSDLLGEGRGLLLLRQRRRGVRGPLRFRTVKVPAGTHPLHGQPTPGALPRRCTFGY